MVYINYCLFKEIPMASKGLSGHQCLIVCGDRFFNSRCFFLSSSRGSTFGSVRGGMQVLVQTDPHRSTVKEVLF